MIDREAYLRDLLGTPYDKRRHHCWWLAAKVQRDLFGRSLPAAPDEFPRPAERNKLLTQHPERGFWQECPTPADGDIVLMARVAGRDIHCGVYLADHRRILHTDEPHGVVLDTELDLRSVRRWRLSFHRPKGEAHDHKDL